MPGPKNDVVAYTVEYYDDAARLAKRYRLNSFADATIELLDLQTRRMFLKRIYYPELSRDRLFAGSVINVHGRALEVVEAADLGTQLYTEEATSTAAALVLLGDDFGGLPALVDELHAAFSSIVTLKTVYFADLPGDLAAQLGAAKPSSLVLAIDCYDSNGKSATRRLEEVLKSRRWIPSTRLDPSVPNAAASALAEEDLDMTLLLVKPHILRSGDLGALLSLIIDGGFELAGAQQLVLDTRMAHEFFSAYKGVLSRYEDILNELTESPCFAVLVKSPVAPFREFCGPADVKIAKMIRPTSLRAQFGLNNVKNALHCTDLDEDGRFESNFFFKVLAGGVA